MSVDRNCYIKGYYKDYNDNFRKIIDFKDEPYKWYPKIEEYWKKYLSFIIESGYVWEDFYITEEYTSSDYGLHDITIYKNGKEIFSAATDEHEPYAKDTKNVFFEECVSVIYNHHTNIFEIKL